VLLRGGVGADLSGAVLERNGWNGLRVECAALPLRLHGARICGNGFDADASRAQLETHGMVIETSHTADDVPPVGSVEPALGAPPAVPPGVTMRDNKGGAWAYRHKRH
jgi:hypothetical protein